LPLPLACELSPHASCKTSSDATAMAANPGKWFFVPILRVAPAFNIRKLS
jgi:hypothetical protein